MEYSNCNVLSVTYQNEETGYSVVKINIGENHLPITCVGIMPSICRGESISINGYWETHKQYGKQFVVQNYCICRPTTNEGIISFLTSGIISTIGPVKAKRIVERFGKDTLDIIEKNPEKLNEISGIGKKTIGIIKKKWAENEHLRKLMIFFKEFDVTLSIVNKIHKKYGFSAQDKISKNPYILCEEIDGIGFVKADKIAQKMGFLHNSYRRIRAGLLHIMIAAQQDGHTCLPYSCLCQKAVDMLDVPEEKVLFSLDHISTARILINNNQMMYLPVLYYAEVGVARNIAGRLHAAISTNSTENIDAWLSEYEQKSNRQFDTMQKKAIKEVFHHQCMIITGGPGTGKTTILKTVVAFCEVLKMQVLLAAPTGRASQRIKETTEQKAYTIHRLLEYSPQKSQSKYQFIKNENNKLEADIIIIDEISMIDIQLMYHLCCAAKNETKLLFIGDSNQLPSVGAGNVLADMIISSSIPNVQLTKVFRQAEKSRIITAAHEINSGSVPVFLNRKEDNCFFIEQSDPQKAVDLLVELVTQRLPDSYKLNPVHDIQVLSPMHKGLLGTENINMLLQNLLHSKVKKINHRQFIYYLGDKVLQIKNNYEKNIYNGDIGFISDIIDGFGLIVDFNGNAVTYDVDMLDELLPAYCISIHKSQGSEFKAVVAPLMTQHYIMLQRNLIYTALTRAKELCVFIGSIKALTIAVETNKSGVRYSGLAERIHDELK